MSGVTSNIARRIRNGATLPASPKSGDKYVKNSGGSEGEYVCITDGTWVLLDVNEGDGTVTSVSVVSANGLAGSVANPSTAPAITLSTSITGVLKGNGTAISTAVAGTDYATPASVDLKANDADVVHDVGDETVAGVKTFSSDPLIPDEAYGVGWNGSLEPPTKNAVYDKVETLATLSPTVREITAATDTITQADNGKIIRANRATGQTITVTGPFTAGFNCVVIQEDAGQTTFAAGGGATVINRQTHTKIAGEGGLASLVCYVADSLILGGDTAA